MGKRIIIVSIALLISLTSFSQIKIISQESLDSVANPALSEKSSFIHFDKKVIGPIVMNEDDKPMKFTFLFHNIGDKSIEISNITTTCGCVRAKSDKDLYEPGEKGVISVSYNPAGHSGKFQRRIFIYADGENSSPLAILTLFVEVSPGKDMSKIYRFQIGDLLLTRKDVTFNGGKDGVERVEIFNSGKRAIIIDVNDELLADFIDFQADPLILRASQKGNIYIKFNSEKYKNSEVKRTYLYLKGLKEDRPEESMITINIE